MFTNQILPVGALLLGAFLLLSAGGLQGLLLPLRGQLEGFDTRAIGIMGSMYSVGFVAGCIYVPRWIRRVGHIRTFGVLASLAASTVLVVGLVIHPVAWIALRALTGFCFAGASMIVESWLNERSTNETRGTIFSVYMIVNLLAITTGQMLLTLGDATATTFFIIAAILFCMSLIPTALSTTGAPAAIASVRLRLGRLYAVSPVGVVGGFAIGLANGAFGTLGAVWATAAGFPVAAVAFFMSAAVVGGAISQLPLGRLSDRVDRRAVLIGICVMAALVAAGFVWLEFSDHTAVILLAGLLGAFVYSMYSITAAHLNDHAPAGSFVETASGLLIVYGAGAALGPILASILMDLMGRSGLFVFLLSVHLTLAAFTLWRMLVRAPVPAEEREAFVAEPRSGTIQSALLDPRAPDDAGTIAPK